MAKEKKIGSVKRFGARYGASLKQKLGEIEIAMKSRQKCPYCHTHNVKRQSAGIWFCSKCKAKFTGGAYSLKKKEIIEEEKEE